jgi:putative nucleotidyltransferase with HDIG domain
MPPLGLRNSDREVNPRGTVIGRINNVKLLLNLLLILFAFFACYLEDIYLFYRPPQPGQTAFLTFRSEAFFDFDQQKIFESLRKAAIAQHIPIYVYNPAKETAIRKKMEAFQAEVFKDSSQGTTGRAAFVGYLREKFGVDLGWEDARRFLRYPDLKNLLSGILTTQESISQGKIVDDPEPLKGKMTVQILYPKPVGASTYPVDEITTLEKARLDLRERVHQLFWQVDPRVLNPVLQISLATLQPNLSYDKEDNIRGIDNIIQQFPSRILPYRPGEVLVPFLKVMDNMDVLLLTASQKASRKDLFGQIPLNLFIICFSVVLYNVLLSRIFTPCWRQEPPYQLFIFVLILTILFCKASLLFTPFPVYIVPFALLPLLLVLLHRERISLTFATVLGATLISLFAGRSLGILLFLSFGGLVALLTSFDIRKRFQIFIPALLVGITNAVVVLLLVTGFHGGLASLEAGFKSLLGLMGWALVGGLAAGLLALLLLPLLELSWHNASVFKLNKFSDLQHPLLVELLTKAPGTYQHSMSAAHLAYVLGETIGANSLLLRVGAYYHDIGKTVQPDFYVENLFGRKSPHDDLPARESTSIIMDHVKEGQKIALEAGLPQAVADFIPQHHGTRLIEYFYDKAVKEHPEAVVNQNDFRYPGPRPQSVEAAILMIVDAVEATSRTIEEPNREKIEAMIRHIIVDRLTDGQFDECNLSTREIATLTDALIHSLEAAFHTRVEYPWQHKEKAESQAITESKDSVELPAPVNPHQNDGSA